ncbi:MAG: 30S ribosomal protein S2 [Verrucomicrobiota bacterium]
MSKVDIKELMDAGVHFGHRTDRWNPKMRPFIFEARNGIYVINLSESARQLEQAQEFLRSIAAEGKRILFVGCKKQAQESIKEFAQKSNSFYVSERWMGGTLTNLTTIRRSVARMKQIDELESKGQFEKMPKQEVAVLRRESSKLHKNLDGIKEMERVPSALVIVDVVREHIAVAEAKRLGIPVVGVVDTNADPDLVDYPIAANDDAIRSIRVILESLSNSISSASKSGGKRGAKGTETTPEEVGVSA